MRFNRPAKRTDLSPERSRSLPGHVIHTSERPDFQEKMRAQTEKVRLEDLKKEEKRKEELRNRGLI